jgi:hypothetical protein
MGRPPSVTDRSWPASAIADDPPDTNRADLVEEHRKRPSADTPSKTTPARSPGAANARAYPVRCYCPRFARFGAPTSVNTNRALSVTQALTSGHETLIPVPVPSLGFQFPVQGTHTLFAAHRPHNTLYRSHVGGFVNSVQSSCRQFTKPPAQFTKPPTPTTTTTVGVPLSANWASDDSV